MKYLVIIFSIILISCSDFNELGTIEVIGMDDVYVNFVQSKRLERIHPIYYQISSEKNKEILRRSWLTGSVELKKDVSDFTARSFNSILYISYEDSLVVYAIYNMNTGEGYPSPADTDWEAHSLIRDSLFNVLKKQNSNLKADWHR